MQKVSTVQKGKTYHDLDTIHDENMSILLNGVTALTALSKDLEKIKNSITPPPSYAKATKHKQHSR